MSLLMWFNLSSSQNITESPTSTVKRSFQGETGLFYETFESNGLRNNSYALGATLLFYGLTDNWELRTGFVHNASYNDIDGDRSYGLGPLQLGTSVDILPEKGFLPQFTIMVDVFLPFLARKEVKPESTDFEIRGIFYHTLSKSANLSYNLGVFFGEENIPIYTLAYVQNFSTSLGSYMELYGDFSPSQESNHYWNVGLTYLITPKLQFDAVVGTAVKGEQDFYFGARLTFSTINNQYILD